MSEIQNENRCCGTADRKRSRRRRFTRSPAATYAVDAGGSEPVTTFYGKPGRNVRSRRGRQRAGDDEGRRAAGCPWRQRETATAARRPPRRGQRAGTGRQIWPSPAGRRSPSDGRLSGRFLCSAGGDLHHGYRYVSYISRSRSLR